MIMPELFIGIMWLWQPPQWLYISFLALLIYPVLLLPIYWLRRASRVWRAAVAVACVGLVGLIGLGLPFAKRSLLEAEAKDLLAGDAVLGAKVSPQSLELRSDSAFFQGHQARCEDLCLRLLFGGEVRRLTVTGADERAMTYWLESRDRCPEAADEFWRWPAVAAWALRGRCLVGSEEVDATSDLMIRIDQSEVHLTRLGDSILHRQIKVTEPGAAGRELVRRSQALYDAPFYPLVLAHAPELGSRRHRGTRWSWQVVTSSRKMPETLDLYETLREGLGFRIAEISPPE